MQKIHIFGQKPFNVRKPLKVKDLRAIAFFNRVIKNYHKMLRIGQAQKEPKIIGAQPYEEVRAICHAVKGITDPDSLTMLNCAEKFMPYINERCNIVPVPSHKGRATDMLALAGAIQKMAKKKKVAVTVCDILRCEPHRSLCEAKHAEGEDFRTIDILMYTDAPFVKPKEKVFLLDNVVDSGKTIRAALKAISADGILAIGNTNQSGFETENDLNTDHS